MGLTGLGITAAGLWGTFLCAISPLCNAVADSMISNQRLRRILLQSSASSLQSSASSALIGHRMRYVTPVPIVNDIRNNRSTCGSRFTKHHSGAVVYDEDRGISIPSETTHAR